MKLRVKPLKQKDVGRGLAAIDRQAMEEMDLENGDYVVIEGTDGGRAVPRVWPGYPEDTGQGIVRIDGHLRQEAGVGVDDSVAVEVADVKSAESITVALPQNLRVRGNVGPHVQNKLSGQAVTEGQTVPFSLGLGPISGVGGQKIPLKIAETVPGGTVVVTDQTEITISEKPADQIRESGHSGDFEITFKCKNCFNEWSECFEAGTLVTEVTDGVETEDRSEEDLSGPEKIVCPNCDLADRVRVTGRKPTN